MSRCSFGFRTNYFFNVWLKKELFGWKGFCGKKWHFSNYFGYVIAGSVLLNADNQFKDSMSEDEKEVSANDLLPPIGASPESHSSLLNINSITHSNRNGKSEDCEQMRNENRNENKNISIMDEMFADFASDKLKENIERKKKKNKSNRKQAREYIPKLRGARKIDELYDEFCVFSGTSCEELANHVSLILQKPLSECNISTFADSEIAVEYNENMRGKDVYIIQSTCQPIHDNMMQLLLLISAARRASARKIIAIIPYYGYGRQDRRRGFDSNLDKINLDEIKLSKNAFIGSINNIHNSKKKGQRETIAASDVAKLFEAVGVDHVVLLDIHRGQVQGFFDVSVPVDNLETLRAVLPVLLEKDLYNPVIVCPSDTGVVRAKKLWSLLHEEGIPSKVAFVTSRTEHDATIEFSDLSSHHRIAGNGVTTELIGNVRNKDVIILDDMIDTGARLINTAYKCHEEGAQRIFVFVTHGVFSLSSTMKDIEASPIDEVFVTNTIFPPPMATAKVTSPDGSNSMVPFVSDKVSYVSVGPIIAEAIRRIQVKNSISTMTHIVHE